MSRIRQLITLQLNSTSSTADKTIAQGKHWIEFRNLSTSAESVTIKNSERDKSFTLEVGDRESFNSDWELNAFEVGTIAADTYIEILYFD